MAKMIHTAADAIQFEGVVSMGNGILNDVATPVSGTDAANRNYVDNAGGKKCATLVVSQIPLAGDYTDIQSALNNLPAGGGLILVREGTYNLSATLLYTDKPVVIRGCGIGNTIISVGANVIPAFTMPGGLTFNQSFAFEDLTIVGTGVIGQKALRVQSDVSVVLSRVDFQSLDVIFDATGSAPSGKFELCTSLITNQLWASSGGVLEVHACTLYIDGATGISGSPSTLIAGSRLNTFGGPYTIAIASLSVISDSRLVAGTVTPTGANCRFVGSAFNSNGLVFTSAGGHVVAGCLFESMTTGISITTTLNSVTGCVFTGVTNPVSESGAANYNKYATNVGFTNSAVIGVNSSVEGISRISASGATSGAFTQVSSSTNPQGVRAIGTIKNTGANSMEVRETVIDQFFVTDSVTTTVTAGNDLMLDPDANVNTARPPYTSYIVAVRHPGAATTYSVRFAYNTGTSL